MSETVRDGISFARLEDLSGPTSDFFEQQRRDIGASYNFGNQIRTLAKMGIAEVKARNLKRVDEIRFGKEEKLATILGVPREKLGETIKKLSLDDGTVNDPCGKVLREVKFLGNLGMTILHW